MQVSTGAHIESERVTLEVTSSLHCDIPTRTDVEGHQTTVRSLMGTLYESLQEDMPQEEGVILYRC